MTPYYEDDLVTLYHGDAVEMLHPDWRLSPWANADVLVLDPPYGIDYRSGKAGALPRDIEGDEDVEARDEVLSYWHGPALIFGSWKMPPPSRTRAALVWDKGPALGMGALDLPWKPSWDLIFIMGRGFTGRRGGGVLRFPPVQSMASNGRLHPHEKPVALMKHLIERCPEGMVADPFMGSGSTLVAAKALGRRAVGVEIDERYCEIAATRCSQEVLGLPA